MEKGGAAMEGENMELVEEEIAAVSKEVVRGGEGGGGVQCGGEIVKVRWDG